MPIEVKLMKSLNRVIKIAVLVLSVSSQTSVAEEKAKTPKLRTPSHRKCSSALAAAKQLKKTIFDTPYIEDGKDSGKTLKSLEIEKRKLMAKKSIYESIDKLKKQKDNFQRSLNPLNEDSFFNSSKDFKSNYVAVQKEIVANQILASVAGSINLLTSEDPEFLNKIKRSKVKRIQKRNKNRQSKSSKTSPASSTQTVDIENIPVKYADIFSACEEMLKPATQTSTQGCLVFLNNTEKFGLSPLYHTGKEFIKEVTNKFLVAANDAKGSKDTLAKSLLSIKNDTILKEIDSDHIKRLTKDTVSLTEAISKLDLLRDDHFSSKKDGEDQVINLINNSTFTNNDQPLDPAISFTKELKLGLETDKIYEDIKDCVTKKAFTTGSFTGTCDYTNHGFKDFIHAVVDYKESPISTASQAFQQLKTNADKIVKNNTFDSFFKDKNQEATIAKLALLGEEDSLSKLLKEVCDDKTFKENFKTDTFDSKEKEKLWKCMEKITATEQNLKNKYAQLDEKLTEINKQIKLTKSGERFKEYDSLLKYSTFLALKECNNAGVSSKKISCGNNNDSFTGLTIGNESFLTNMTKLEWELAEKKNAEKFLGPVLSACNSEERNKKVKIIADTNTPSTNEENKKNEEDIERSSVLLKLCEEVRIENNIIENKKPSPKLQKAHRDFNYKYNSTTKRMDRTERRSWTTNIGSAVAKSALNNGLPLFLSNAQFKNNLGYSTDMAIYKKNQMYLLNNPEYMFSGSYFSGYGVSGYPNYYGAPSYYGF